jgi:hypothetical protein
MGRSPPSYPAYQATEARYRAYTDLDHQIERTTRTPLVGTKRCPGQNPNPHFLLLILDFLVCDQRGNAGGDRSPPRQPWRGGYARRSSVLGLGPAHSSAERVYCSMISFGASLGGCVGGPATISAMR